MIAIVGSVLQSIAGCSEGCPCHDGDPQFRGATYWKRRVARQKLLGNTSCPMATRRAPECASGALPRMLTNLFDMLQADFLLREDVRSLPEHSRALALRDLAALRRHLRFNFGIKFSF